MEIFKCRFEQANEKKSVDLKVGQLKISSLGWKKTDKKQINICIMGVPQEEERQRGQEII